MTNSNLRQDCKTYHEISKDHFHFQCSCSNNIDQGLELEINFRGILEGLQNKDMSKRGNKQTNGRTNR